MTVHELIKHNRLWADDTILRIAADWMEESIKAPASVVDALFANYDIVEFGEYSIYIGVIVQGGKHEVI